MRETSGNRQSATQIMSSPKPNVEKHKCRRVRKYLKEYCETTTFHGLRYLTENRSICERLLWAILIVISVGICGYLISRIYQKYNQSPVIVSFATKESPIFSIPFPAVTICPMSKAQRALLNFTKIIHKLQDNETITPEEKLNAQYLSLLCEEGIEYFLENKTFTNDFYDKLHKLQVPLTTIIPCTFMGKEMACSDIFKPIILDEGICYTFNMLDRDEIYRDNVVHYSNYHKNDNTSEWNIDNGYSENSGVDTYPRRALLSGADNALEIMFLHLKNNSEYLCVEDAQGYSVALHSPDTIPSPQKQYFQVPFNSAVIANIQPRMMTTSQEVKKYDPIDRECYFTNERPLKFFKIYTPENCRLECLTNYTLSQCGCVDFYMPRDNVTLICGTGNFHCMMDAEKRLKEIELYNLITLEDDEETEIYCDCMPLCTALTYDMEQSQSYWNWNEQLKALRIPQHEIIKKDMILAKLSIFFKLDQFLTSQRNELYGPTDFLANFGGLLGLFTGFSLLSLVEFIYFFSIRICCNIRRYKIWTGTPE